LKYILLLLFFISCLHTSENLPIHVFTDESRDPEERVGDFLQLAVPVSALTTTLLLEDYEGTKQAFLGLATTVLTTHLLKETLNTERPNGGDHSFPSGHTSSAFSGAAFIHHRYGFKYSIAPYLAASYVGWSRIEANKHHPHDVLAGAALAITVSYFITTKYENVEVTPIIGNNIYGVKIGFDF
jgi:membrane-associated phospholipid phosphatase